MKKLFLIILILSNVTFTQSKNEELIPILYKGNDNIYINSSGIENFKGDDIFVWVIREHSNPITVESVEDKIFKTKSYYLFNKKLNKYSILNILYYDDSGNVLASYDYNRKTDIEAYQYNYPIWKNSVELAILNKCLDIISSNKLEDN